MSGTFVWQRVGVFYSEAQQGVGSKPKIRVRVGGLLRIINDLLTTITRSPRGLPIILPKKPVTRGLRVQPGDDRAGVETQYYAVRPGLLHNTASRLARERRDAPSGSRIKPEGGESGGDPTMNITPATICRWNYRRNTSGEPTASTTT